MKAQYFSLVVGVFVFALAIQPQTAKAQFCFSDGFGFTWDIGLDGGTDIFFGTTDILDTQDWQMTGGRGTNARTLRHHVMTAINPDLDDDPGCGDLDGNTDWFTYNGLVSGSGFPYTYSGSWYNSCGLSGAFSGSITSGACPAPRATERPAVNPAAVAAPQAGVRATEEGYALTSSPNPFDVGAVISYTIPEAVHVRITVYDTLGREVAVLVDAAREAGTHTVVFDGASLAAGTYVYRIEAGAYAEAKQMVLVR